MRARAEVSGGTEEVHRDPGLRGKAIRWSKQSAGKNPKAICISCTRVESRHGAACRTLLPSLTIHKKRSCELQDRRKRPLGTTVLIATGLGRVWTQVWKRTAVALPCSCTVAEVSAVDHPQRGDPGLTGLFVVTYYGCSYALSVLTVRKQFYPC